MDPEIQQGEILRRRISRRNAMKAGGIAAVGLAFNKPIIQTLHPRPAFAQMSPIITPPQPCIEPPPGMIGWWPGDGNANDIVGGNHGTLQGGATFASGKVNQAFSLRGQNFPLPSVLNDYVSIPFNSNFNFAPTGQFTIDAWVNPGRVSGFQAIVVRDVPKWDWGLWQSGNRFLTGHHSRPLTGSITVTVGTWVHVAVTYDNGFHKLYVNGVLDVLSGSQTPITQSTNPLALGRRIDINGVHYQGLLDEVELFNRALTQNEIQNIYNAGSDGKCKYL